MKILIRKADMKEDALAIIDGAKDFASRVAFRDLFPKDHDAFVDAISRIMLLEGMELLVAEYDGEIVGGIGILYAPFTWNPARLAADELFWWAASNAPFRTAKLLIDEAWKRICDRDAIPMFHIMATSPQGVDRAYRKLGLEPMETTYMVNLTCQP